MDIIQNLIKDLRLKGILLSCSGENLEIAQVDDLDIEENDINLIRQYKKEIITYFQSFISQKNDLEIPNAPKQEYYPLSSSQERLWILSQFPESSVAYNMPFQRELDGDYDLDSFEKAIRSVIDKHEILRTVFISLDSGEVRQRVLSSEEIDFNIQYIDCSQKTNTLEYIETYIKNDSYKPFDLEYGPLLRVSLLKASDAKYILYFNMHHIISDGWSLKVLTKDILEYYEAYVGGRTITVEPLKIQYKDYAYWQKDQSNNEKQLAQEKYWVKKFSDEPSIIDLPTNKVRPSIMSHNGRSLKVYLPTEVVRQFKERCKEEGASLFMGILASWNILFHKYTSLKDIIIGSPVTGRSQASLEDQIGFYVNTILFRNQIDPNQNFIDFLHRIKETTLEAYTYQEYPFDKLIKNLGLENDASRNRLFDVLLNFQETSTESSVVNQDERREVSIIDGGICKSKLDLEISFQNSDNDLSFNVIYNTDVYEEDKIRKFLSHYTNLLEKLLSNTNSTIGEIDILLKEEERLLHTFNNTRKEYPENKTILDLYKEQLENNGDAIAVIFDDKKITFNELESLSNKMAIYLKNEFSIQKQDLVAIKLHRSEWMQIAIVAVLKLGATYIPIDPDYPQQRLEYIQKDSGYTTCIDENTIRICIDNLSSIQEEFLAPEVLPEDIAYVIYTSGSTGNPKGVLNNHAGLYNRLLWMRDDLEITNKDKLLQKTPYTFDVSVWELTMPLITGATLIFAKPDGHKDPLYLEEIIEEYAISIIHFVPSMLGVFLMQASINTCNSLRHLVCSGEALPEQVVTDFKKLFLTTEIHNYYGPTEAAIDVTAINLSDSKRVNTSVSIGYPVANTSIYITNEDLKLQPIGVIGELIIEGIQVAQGYLNKPELTKTKFLESPFVKGERIYRTGDLARWLPDGSIEYIGRIDNQIKIRGNRIEIGEIENSLQQSEIVQQSVVVVKKDQVGNQRLIAYVVPKEGCHTDILNKYLKDNLPSYMIPSLIIELSEIPVTANGKLNRKALPEPTLDEVSSQKYVAPRNKIEEALVDLWIDVLGYEKVGIEDSFFQLGGDSIVAIRLISKINKYFNVRLGVDLLYKYQTISELSQQLIHQRDSIQDEGLYNQVQEELKSLKKEVFDSIKDSAAIEDVYPMSDIQKGMVFSSIINPGSAVYHDQFVYQIPKLDRMSFEKAFQLMVNKHSILRTSFDVESYEEQVQIVYNKIPVEIEYQDISLKTASEKEAHITNFVQKERKNPFDLTKAPLWRATIIDIESTESVFVFQFHHAILDGWSVASFNIELFDIYNKLIENEQYTINTLEYSYKEAVAQEIIEKKRTPSIQFWKDELSDYKRLDIFSKTRTTDHYMQRYDATFLNTIKARASQDNISLKSVLFGSYMYALKMLTYEEDIVVGLVSNNRPIVEDGDKILGCFLNTLPVRINFENYKEATWIEYFKGIEKQQIQLKGKDRMPLFEISKILNERTDEKNPFFDVLFNFIDFHIYDDFGADVQENDKEEFKFLKNQSYESTNTMLDLTLSATGGALNFDYKLSRKLTSNLSLRRLHGYFDKMLHCYLNNPQKEMSNNDILSLDEKKELLEVYGNEKKKGSEKTILDLFAQQVKNSPDEIALVVEKSAYTYKELDLVSNQLALFIQTTYKISKGDLIGMMLARDEWSIISILAIIKLGAVYVPIDKNYPEERKQYIKDDSQYKICLDEEIIQDFVNKKSKYSQVLEDQNILADNLLYVIYTSGTTGNPKGVMVSHRNLVAFIPNLDTKLNLTSYKSIAATASFTFDISILEVLGGLCTGKEVHLFSDKDVNDPFRIMEKLKEQQIDIIQLTPSRLIQLYDTKIAFPESLKVMLIGGEALDSQTYNNLKQEHFQSINVYGPTEATIWSSRHILKENENLDVGIPMDQEQVYILNQDHALQPKGVIGEICIGGVGVTQGYLNKEALTQERFIENPFVQNSTLYKTGDIGKWLPNGNLAFLGRKDDQVKILGYRIELGEVENALLRHPDIQGAVVLAKEVNTTEKLLVAYLISDKNLESSELRKFLKGILPAYMIPSYFVTLDEFPITSNGKIDRKALNKLDEGKLSTKIAYVAPTNELQEQLVAIWEKVLQKDKIGIQDNFFDLGGHSLLAVKIASDIQRMLDVKVEITKLFLEPTIAELAIEIENQSWQNTSVVEENVADRILI
ncbi:amino acid adenylation domain-containing protein [Dokdonia ponticola]|uniref:Amino acid adenylation domain-containing protein n=1 Tax=Dokdonia ponticola TaxID=2041041 RepID=A0ABV9I141_9FLAO